MTQDAFDHSKDGQVLKSDTRGRVWSTPAQRQALLEQFERSGLSGPRFAAVAGIKYQTFIGWRRKQRLAQSDSLAAPTPECGTAPTQWVEASLGEAKTSQGHTSLGALRVRWQNSTFIEISATSQVALAAALLRDLENGGRWPC